MRNPAIILGDTLFFNWKEGGPRHGGLGESVHAAEKHLPAIFEIRGALEDTSLPAPGAPGRTEADQQLPSGGALDLLHQDDPPSSRGRTYGRRA
jgi:hypothetical protein